jgi:hypothetical protein
MRAQASGSAIGVALTLAGVGARAVCTVIPRKLLAADTALTVVAVQRCAALGFAVLLFAGSRLTGRSAPIGDQEVADVVLGVHGLHGWCADVVRQSLSVPVSSRSANLISPTRAIRRTERTGRIR